jgi:4-amino-4-deoxy-L-arabinose transferase-like glycosyltransferase
MKYFLELVKKEYIEIKYSWKQLLLYGLMFVAFFFFVAEVEKNAPLNTSSIQFNNYYYFLTIFLGFFAPSNLLMESIFSDKRNQTFERYFVSGNIKTIMFAKLSAISVFGIIPFIIFYTYLLFNGINIIDNIYAAINTPLYFWICLCVTIIISFLFNDEKSASLACMPFLLLVAGLLYLNDFLAVKFYPAITVIVTIICAAVVAVIAYKFYKKTKYFLKI